MKRWIKIIVAFMLLLMTVNPMSSSAATPKPSMADYTSYPLFQTDAVEPNIMIILDNSASMNANAYGAWMGSGNLVGSSYEGAPYNNYIKTVSSSSDDAEQRVTDGYAYTSGSSDLDIGRDIDTNHNDMLIGVRFQNIEIDKGTEITDAYIVFTSYDDYSASDEADIIIDIHGQDAGNAETFSTGTNSDISSRPKTGASVSWTIPAWNTKDVEHNTPDISALVQEIINRDDWQSGNAMTLILSNPSGEPLSGRRAYSYEGSPSKAPRLVIHVAQSDAKKYYGYFNPDFLYTYDSNTFNHKYKKVSYDYDNEQWTVISDLATIDDDNPTTKTVSNADFVSEKLWDGNWMNWCTMRRIDVLRKVLMGGLATSRTGGGNQVNYGESNDQGRYFVRHFDTSSSQAVSPYNGNYYYGMEDGYIHVDNDDDPVAGYTERISLSIQKEVAYEPEDFVQEDDGGYNVAGVLQRYGDQARWGNMWFNFGTGKGESGGFVAHTIGTNMTTLVTDLQNTDADTWTPLSETMYVATQYFKQEDVQSGLDYPNNVVPNANVGQDPYHNGTEYVHCAKSFVILLTDGAPTVDTKIPSALKDYDGDSNDSTLCTETSSSGCAHGYGGSDYLDDVALYARTTDLRSDLEGDQNIILYTVYAMGDDDHARALLKDAARNGGFEDRDADNRPDGDYSDPAEDRLEWDQDGDGLPDTYFEASDGYELEEALGESITDILRRAASGTAVSIISSATEGEGNIIQAYFRPNVPSSILGNDDVKWIGSLQSLWIDPLGNMREDTPASATASTGDKALDITHDKIIRFVDDNGVTKVEKYLVSDTEPYPDLSTASPDETVSLSDLSAYTPVWEAGSQLGKRSASDRTIYTYVDKNQDNAVDSDEFIEFSLANKDTIKPFLGVYDNTDWSDLGTTGDDRCQNIINFIRGENSGFTGDTLIRDRSIPTNPADAENTLVDWKLGDIVHSTPVIISTPFESYDLLYSDESYYHFYIAMQDRESVVYAGANDGMIHAFTSWKYNSTTQTYEKPTSTSEDIGDELWGFIPQALLPHLKWLPGTDYTHVYYCDMKIKIFEAKILPDDTHYTDADTEKNWGTFLITGLNYGGKHIWVEDDFDGDGKLDSDVRHFYPSYVCIDITDPRNPSLMWERSYSIPDAPPESADNATDQGLATAFPSIMKVGEKWFAVFGSGPYDFEGNSSGNGHVFVVDLETGEPYRSDETIDSKTGLATGGNDWLFETDDDNAFMASSVSLDKNMNYNVDAVYIPTTFNSGNATNPKWDGAIYKIRIPFELNTPIPSDIDMFNNYGDLDYGSYISDPNKNGNPWEMKKLVEVSAPLTSSPAISIDGDDNAWIYFGTGRYLSEDDEISTDDQYIYGIKDPFFNRLYVQTPPDTATDYYHNPALNKEITSSTILNTDDYQVLTTGELSTDGTSLSGTNLYNLVDIMDSKDGWERTQSIASGARVLSKPGILGGIVFATSFVPNQDICSFSGDSYLYGLYYLTGTAYSTQVFTGDDGITTLTISDDSYDKVLDIVYLGGGLGSAPGIHIGTQEGNEATGFIQTSTGFIHSLGLDPALPIRSGLETWREQQ